MATASWCASVGGTELALLSWQQDGPLPLIAGAAVVVAFLLVAARSRRGVVRWITACGAVAMALSLSRGAALTAVAIRLESDPPQTRTAVVIEDPATGPFGTTVTVRLDAASGRPRVSVTWPEGEAEPLYGERVAFDSRLRMPARSGEFAADSFRRAEVLKASPWRVRRLGPEAGLGGVITGWRNASVRTLYGFGGRGAEALASMLFAARPGGPGAEALEDAKTAGVAWLITASGIHLGAIVLLVERLAAALGAQRRGRAIAAVAAVCVVAIAAGLRLSLLRAAIAAAVTVLSRLVGRRRDATATLGAAILLLVVLDPAAPYDTGLAIAIAAVSAIAMIGPIARVWLRPVVGRTASWALGASVTAQLGVAPIAASLFGGVALAGPVVLALSAPVVQAAVTLGLAGSLLAPVSEAAGGTLLRLGSLAAELATRVWGLAARLPGAVLAVPAVPAWAVIAWVAGAAGLWLWWPSPRRLARVRIGALVLSVALLASTLVGGLTGESLVVLDVGQGDAILLRDAGETVLVDVGPDGAVLRQALARADVRSVTGIVLTHAHEDHVGGLEGLAGLSRPKWIGVPDVKDEAVEKLAARASPYADGVLRLHRDMTFDVGRIHARVLWPRGGEERLSTNDTSVILLLERDGRYALLLGDAEDVAQHGAVETWGGVVETVKVAHHGSMNGNVPEALERWQPRLALISVGDGNRFGHPHAEALEELASIGAEVHRTDLEGDLGWDLAGGPAAGSSAAVASAALCDNRSGGRPARGLPELEKRVCPWLLPTSTTSNRSISSTAPRSCSSSVRRSAFANAWPPSPTSTSIWRPSMVARPPPTTSSTPPTPCRS